MESEESKVAKLHARLSYQRERNWRTEENYKRYQEANGLIPKRPLRPKGQEINVDRWRCELKPNEFKHIRRKIALSKNV